MAHEFLSDDWWRAVAAIRDRYADQAEQVPFQLRINQVVTGVPFGDGESRFHIDSTSGRMEMGPGEIDGADATVTTDYATARSLVVDQDQAAGMQAFMAGKIRVQGDMTKLMQMNAAPSGEVARKVAEEIKAITA